MFQPFFSILLKEIKTNRSLLAAFAIGGIILAGITMFFSQSSARETGSFCIMIFISYLSLLAFAATSFSKEREEGTMLLLRNYPIKPRTILAGKTAFILLAVLILLSLFVAVFLLVYGYEDLRNIVYRLKNESGGDAMRFVFSLVFIPVDLLLWGIFWSLRCRRQISSILLTVFCAFPMSVIFISAFMKYRSGQDGATMYFIGVLMTRILLLLFLGVMIDIKLKNWFYLSEKKNKVKLKYPLNESPFNILCRMGNQQILFEKRCYIVLCLLSFIGLYLFRILTHQNGGSYYFLPWFLMTLCFTVNIFHFDLHVNNIILCQRRVTPFLLWRTRLNQYGVIVISLQPAVFAMVMIGEQNNAGYENYVKIFAASTVLFFFTAFCSAFFKSRLIAGMSAMLLFIFWGGVGDREFFFTPFDDGKYSFDFFNAGLFGYVYTLVIVISASWWIVWASVMPVRGFQKYSVALLLIGAVFLPAGIRFMFPEICRRGYSTPEIFYPRCFGINGFCIDSCNNDRERSLSLSRAERDSFLGMYLQKNDKKCLADRKIFIELFEDGILDNEIFCNNIRNLCRVIQIRYFSFETDGVDYNNEDRTDDFLIFQRLAAKMRDFDFARIPLSETERMIINKNKIGVSVTVLKDGAFNRKKPEKESDHESINKSKEKMQEKPERCQTTHSDDDYITEFKNRISNNGQLKVNIIKEKIGTLVFSINKNNVSQYLYTARSLTEKIDKKDRVLCQLNAVRGADPSTNQNACYELVKKTECANEKNSSV